ncbi:zinc ribbon domain-containing protein [Pseudomonas sp. SG20052]|uniref:zinc ribbon domain-containing protein n=1 Tax=Pseudomonas sp. SG20052 TaxID=3074147 RepID=UPI00287F7C03|nr:zinc ribbon domain-containing protein [Pseudomonas sp. SG20052]WNF54039.1 zinc ribbon domain-containing protein [Pseudomonas sp. SG20052]
MRNFGYFVLVVGMLCIVGALAMDVSVSAGAGRVNNIGLMAERQNLILIGGLMLLVGVIMAIAGKRQKEVIGSSNDGRACPICAETIKCAALKCKHCGSEVESINNGNGGGDVRPIVEPMDRETIKLWVARGSLLTIFMGIILYSLLGR